VVTLPKTMSTAASWSMAGQLRRHTALPWCAVVVAGYRLAFQAAPLVLAAGAVLVLFMRDVPAPGTSDQQAGSVVTTSRRDVETAPAASTSLVEKHRRSP
jgi:hypothetical protein